MDALVSLDKLNDTLNIVIKKYKLPKNYIYAHHIGDGVYISIELKENCKNIQQWKLDNLNILISLNKIIGLDSKWIIQHKNEDVLELFLPLNTIFSNSEEYYNEIDRIINCIHSDILG